MEIARGIEAASGENALVFTFGGDEFGVILYEASLQQTREVAERVRASSEEVHLTLWDKTKYRMLTLSVGIAHSLLCGDLVETAITALQKAKVGGRNRVSE